MGAFAAVAQGSAEPAQLITLEYAGAGVAGDAPRLALVGKAVTFDSGGLSLKPPNSMIEMKFDMMGGAAVIEAIAALAELEVPVRVLGIVGATENLVSDRSVKPGDIVTALDGTTIEVNNTDAEGRLVLADCITHARRLGCDAIVDIATLTGGVVIALGATYAGLMANDDALAAQLIACGERTGELLWRLPLHPAYAEMVKGRYAQLTNRTAAPRGLGDHRRGVPAPLRRRRAMGAPGHRGRRRRRPRAVPRQGRHRLRGAAAGRAGGRPCVDGRCARPRWRVAAALRRRAGGAGGAAGLLASARLQGIFAMSGPDHRRRQHRRRAPRARSSSARGRSTPPARPAPARRWR